MPARVMSMDTGETLPGPPSERLEAESDDAIQGAVPAYWDGERWEYCPPSERQTLTEHHGMRVITVWVES